MGLKVISVAVSFQPAVPITGLPSGPIREKFVSTLAAFIGWLNTSVISLSSKRRSSGLGRTESSCGAAVVKDQSPVDSPSASNGLPAVLVRSRFR